MKKDQIFEVIKSNSKLGYDEIKKHALEAGISEKDFNEAWQNFSKQKKLLAIKKIIIVIAALIGVYLLYIYFLGPLIFGKSCESIKTHGACLAREDCTAITEYVLEFGFDGGYVFNECTKLILTDEQLKDKELCEETGGIWKKTTCECHTNRTMEERKEAGFYFFKEGVGCYTDKQTCIDSGGDWDRWDVVKKPGCTEDCIYYKLDPEAIYNCNDGKYPTE